MESVRDLGRERVLYCAADGPIIGSEQDATALIGEAFGERATLIALPVGRLDPTFFQLRSGLAGAVTQKCVNYRLKLAVIGEIDAYLAASGALRDWVRECARGDDVLFVPSREALVARLAVDAGSR